MRHSVNHMLTWCSLQILRKYNKWCAGLGQSHYYYFVSFLKSFVAITSRHNSAEMLGGLYQTKATNPNISKHPLCIKHMRVEAYQKISTNTFNLIGCLVSYVLLFLSSQAKIHFHLKFMEEQQGAACFSWMDNAPMPP